MEPFASTPHRAEELVQVHLERREHLVDPVLGLELLLPGLAPGVVDDLLGLALGELDDLRLRRLARGLLACLAEDPVALALRLGEHLLPLLDDPARLLDLLGNGGPHLVEDVVDLLAVDAHLVGQRDGLRVVHEVVELVDEYENVHGRSVYWLERGLLLRVEGRARPAVRDRARRTVRRPLGGTNSSTFPPNEAISFTPLEETKLNCGLAMTYTVSMSGASVRFRWFIWNSHSKSEIARSPLTIVVRAPAAGEVDDQLGEDVHLDVAVLVQGVAEELDALLDGEHRPLVVRVADDADDDAVEDAGRALDHVQVAVRDGVVAAGTDRGRHSCSNSVRRAEP